MGRMRMQAMGFAWMGERQPPPPPPSPVPLLLLLCCGVACFVLTRPALLRSDVYRALPL